MHTETYTLTPEKPGTGKVLSHTDDDEKLTRTTGQVKALEEAAWLAHVYGNCRIVRDSDGATWEVWVESQDIVRVNPLAIDEIYVLVYAATGKRYQKGTPLFWLDGEAVYDGTGPLTSTDTGLVETKRGKKFLPGAAGLEWRRL